MRQYEVRVLCHDSQPLKYMPEQPRFLTHAGTWNVGQWKLCEMYLGKHQEFQKYMLWQLAAHAPRTRQLRCLEIFGSITTTTSAWEMKQAACQSIARLDVDVPHRCAKDGCANQYVPGDGIRRYADGEYAIASSDHRRILPCLAAEC